jgi:two-component system sensor kinase FixL
MSWVTVIWSMCASACLTLAFVHLLVWVRNRGAWASLVYALAAVGAAAYAFCELWVLMSRTPDEFATAVRWTHVALWCWSVPLAGFVYLYLQAGRAWLLWSFIGLRTVLLALNFLTGQNLNYLEITAVQQVPFLGQPVAVATGVANPAMVLGQFSVLVLLLFVADAGLTAWRRGNRRQALMISGSIVAVLVASSAQGILVVGLGRPMPFTISLFQLGILAVMGYELSRDVLRASQLVGDLQASAATLQETQQRMNLAADAAKLGLWVWQPGSDDIWATPRCCTMLGLPIATHFSPGEFTERVHPDDRELVASRLRRALAHGLPYEAQYRVQWPGGGDRWIEATGRVDGSDHGGTRRVHGVCIDITESRLAEQKVARLRDEVLHAGRVSMMGQLAASLAHEINQPLGAILRNAEAAELFLQNPEPDLEEIRAIVADIRHDDQRAGAVIDRMRSLLRRQDLRATAVDVGDLLADVWMLVRADAAARHVRLEVGEVPADLPAVCGDRVHLQQVLINLVFNAMDALTDAPGSVRRVGVEAQRRDDQWVEFSVSDTGTGIEADRLARIFEPFFTTKTSGMGMGLSISRTIVEAHGGRLWPASRAEGGTVFSFTLPVMSAAATA